MCNNTSDQATEFLLAGFPYLHGYQPGLFTMLLIIYFTILLGNALILIASVTVQKLHKPMYFFLCNLAVLDIIYTTSSIPKLLALLLFNVNNISFTACFIQMCFSHTMGLFESFLLMVMAYDRYVAICNPLHYSTIMNKQFNVHITASSFVAASVIIVALTIFTAHLPYTGSNIINHCFCDHFSIAKLACADITLLVIWVMLIIVVLVLIPFSFVVFSYVNILRAVLKMNSAVGRQKTFSTCSSHLTVVVIYYISIVISFSSYRPGDVSDDFHALGTIFSAVFAPALNPVIYTLRNRDIQQGIKTLIKAKTVAPKI
ncbi:olfactory receptor 2AT4-like [Protopterus annectens]|uniref:olfactory receptor 2AT4-like n=1 Tax=Protopterus annectens TaxID=7888 RepID=UPI001CFBC4A9|nr:olfactory receptor 2AT4-like [Protopterus annectens]